MKTRWSFIFFIHSFIEGFEENSSFFHYSRSFEKVKPKIQQDRGVLLSTRFPPAGLLTTHVRTDWLLDWSLAAKRARQLITYLLLPIQQTEDVSMMRVEQARVLANRHSN